MMARPDRPRRRDEYRDDEQYDPFQSDDIQENLAALPLPGPTLVVDLRPINQRNSTLLWDLEGELEDLASDMRLHHIPRWRHLAKCIRCLRVDTIEANVSLNEASEFVIVTRDDETHHSTKQELMYFITNEFINGVRNSRAGAIHDTEDGIQRSMQNEPHQPTVRVFLLIDMRDTLSLTNAILFSHDLKQFNYDYDDPNRTGRDERVSTIALCMNTNQEQRHELLLQELRDINPSRTKFDMIILLQQYRNDDTYNGEGVQNYEVDIILYTLALVSSEQLAGAWESDFDEQDLHYYVTPATQSAERTPPTPIYVLGLAVIEYSARWGKRWLDYRLASKAISILCDSDDIEPDNHLLDMPQNEKQNWFDIWWHNAQEMLPLILDVQLPHMESLLHFQQQAAHPIPQMHTLHAMKQYLNTQLEQFEDSYKKFGDPTFTNLLDATRRTELLSLLLKNDQTIRDRRANSDNSDSDVPLQATLKLQEEAEQFLSSLFHGARGAIPRAIQQLIELQHRVAHIENIASNGISPYILRKEFDQTTTEIRKEIDTTIPHSLPIVGVLTRMTMFVLVALLSVGILCWFGLGALLPIMWTITTGHQPSLIASFHNPFFILLMGLRLCFLVALVGAFWYMQHRRFLHYEETLRSLVQRLQKVSQEHHTKISTILTARAALSILERAGIYASHGNPCRLGEHLQHLEQALIHAQDEAEEEWHNAEKRLAAGLSERESVLQREQPWVNLRIRKDLLPFEDMKEVYDTVEQKFRRKDSTLSTLANHMLMQMGVAHSSNKRLVRPLRRISASVIIEDEKQLQNIASELASAMILSQAIDYDLTQIQPLVDRYLQLQSYSHQQISSFAESVGRLQEEVKNAYLEQGYQQRGQNRSNRQFETQESFLLYTTQTITETLAMWAGNQYHSEMQSMLDMQSIAKRLLNKHISSADALSDLQARYALFGYHNPGHLEDDDRFYLLMLPGFIADEFLSTLDIAESVQAPSFRRLHFPDSEKLIYLHVHRLQISSSHLPTT